MLIKLIFTSYLEKNSNNDSNQEITLAVWANFSFDFGPVLPILRRFLPLCIIFGPLMMATSCARMPTFFQVWFTYTGCSENFVLFEFYWNHNAVASIMIHESLLCWVPGFVCVCIGVYTRNNTYFLNTQIPFHLGWQIKISVNIFFRTPCICMYIVV